MSVVASEECLLAERLGRDEGLRLLLLFKAVTCALSATATIGFACYTGLSWLVNPNAKILFANHLFWMIELPLCYGFVYSFDYYRLSQSAGDPCVFTVSNAFALLSRFPAVVGIVAQATSLFVFCIERAISTARPVRYERVQNSTLGLVLATVSSGSAILLVYFMLVAGASWNGIQYWYSVRTDENKQRYQLLTNFCLCIELLSLSIFFGSCWKNSRCEKEKRTNRLSRMYQRSENRRIICSLIPVVILHFAFSALNSTALSLFPLVIPDDALSQHKIWMEWIGQTHLYPLFACLTLLCLRRAHRKSFVPSVHPIASEVYFESLKNIFDNANVYKMV